MKDLHFEKKTDLRLDGTKTLLEERIAGKYLDTYAVLVSVRGEKGFISSENADAETYFDIASCGKALVTAPLILKSVSRGMLSLEDTLGKFFPSVPNDKKDITVKQLLTHTSGIIRYVFPKEVAAAGHDAVAEYILGTPLSYAPGTNYIYSCNGYALLGFILEKLYGKQLDEVFYEHLKTPLGLTRARYNIAADEPNAAVCYERPEACDLRVDDCNVYNMGGVSGAGCLFYTANDMGRFCEAVLAKSGDVYPEEYYALAEADYTPRFSWGRGLGYTCVDSRYPQTGELFPVGSFGHTGWTGASFFINREKEMYAVVLTNTTRFTSIRNHFAGVDPSVTHRVRTEVHNAIKKDLARCGGGR